MPFFFFLFFFSWFLFRFDPKTDHSYFTRLTKVNVSCSGSKTKKNQLWCLYISNTMPIFFFFFSCFFFRFDPKTDHSYFTCLTKINVSCSGSKSKKNQLWCLYISNTMPLCSFSCSSLVDFFFVLTQNRPFVLYLPYKNQCFLLWVKNEKKNQLWCLYISNTMLIFFLVLL